MKKIIYLLTPLSVLFLLHAPVVKAQYKVGTNDLNLGIGLGTFYTYLGGPTSPVFSVSYEHGIVKLGSGIAGNLGLGGILSYQHEGYTNSYYNVYTGGYTDTYSWSTIFIGARGTWHPDFSQFMNQSKVDLYAALDLGVLIISSSVSGPNTNGYAAAAGGIRGGPVIGGRYFFTDNVAGFLELGYDVAYLKLGVTFKF
jgi:hypothetical protein